MHIPHPITAHHRQMIARPNVFFALICLAMFLAACGSSTPPTTTTGSTATCNKTTGLTLYSAQGYDNDAAKAFQQQTGITTKLVDDSTGNLLAKIAAEGSNPQWDVTWFDGNVTMQALDDQSLLLKWHSPNTSNLTSQGAQYVPSRGLSLQVVIFLPGM